jgi:carbon storage regulator
MLVLTRKLMEKLYIGEDICVTVVRLEGGQVRLGIEAPREVAVVRAELVDGHGILPRGVDRPCASAGETNPTAASPQPFGLRTRPASVPGTGIRRRGPSR